LKKPFFFQTEKWLKELENNPLNKVQAFNCSHWVMIDKADEFNQAVKKWLLK
jgi:pimeloyl-ACP methyl ester carboxylesterase